LRRPALGFAPVHERLAVAAVVLASGSDRDERARRCGSVYTLAPDACGNPHQFALAEFNIVPLDDDGQLSAQHEVDLLLPPVAVDAPSLPRLERDLIDPERLYSEGDPQRNEALGGVVVNHGSLDSLGAHHRGSVPQGRPRTSEWWCPLGGCRFLDAFAEPD